MSKMSQTEVTRSNLMEAFWELYKEKPLAKITVREITDRAGYNRGTFYAYFSDVYEIQEVFKNSLIPERDMIIGHLKHLDEDNAGVFESFDKTNEYIRRNWEKIAVMVGPEGDPGFIYEFKKEIREMIMGYVEEIGIREPEKFEYIIEYQISAYIGIFQLWIERCGRFDEKTLAEIMDEVANKGAKTLMESMLNDKS
ncbi:TetR/AcrR family transcriptional regulator [Lacicoccus alkaliphilus]|uniref:Transcriptional regulator, TetR family n=1 Tax=Lacicoccus alkaliphilus DSM 16010 TaxID=1123231 RepID=A0A1M7DRG7_9BACL|nr:TetR/AcrR family transcriptional regulator [Salinicoccus alkaliphilus]SHL81997.1 transcriptional regulator, TetR family [Salinicoccus alkaliphilus DSM 16010]